MTKIRNVNKGLGSRHKAAVSAVLGGSNRQKLSHFYMLNDLNYIKLLELKVEYKYIQFKKKKLL